MLRRLRSHTRACSTVREVEKPIENENPPKKTRAKTPRSKPKPSPKDIEVHKPMEEAENSVGVEEHAQETAPTEEPLPENVEVQKPIVRKRRNPKSKITNEQSSGNTLLINSSVETSSEEADVQKAMDNTLNDDEVEQKAASEDYEVVDITVEAETDDKHHEMTIEAEPLKVEDDLQTVGVQPSDKRLQNITIEYRNRKYTIRPLFQAEWREKNEDRTLLNDTLIEFYMCNFMWNDVYGDVERGRFHVFHTFFYSKLRLRFGSYYKNAPRRSELAAQYNRHFQRVPPRSILQKEVLIIPIHLEKPKHWFLVLVHNPSGGIRRCTPVNRNEKSMRERSLTSQVNDFAHFEKAGECRIVIMDSLFVNQKFRVQLDNAYAHAFDYIRLWLQMAAAANDEEMMKSRIRKVVCKTLPQQKNSVDCGLYMMNYAEYFTKFNTEWITKPTDELAYLTMPEENANELETGETRNRVDKLLQTFKTEDNPINDTA